MASPQRLTVIVPAHNEEQRLGPSLERIVAWASAREPRPEILVVESGSTDGTGALAKQFAARHSCVRVIHAPSGKGRAIADGVAAATGDVLYMCDADLSMPIEDADRLLQPVLDRACDIAIGSREGRGAQRVGEPEYRHVMGRVFNFVVKLAAVPGIDDTQCGFKCFRAEAVRPIFQQLTIMGFAFDVELLFLARRAGLKILVVPIVWHFDGDTRVRPGRDALLMFRDVMRIRLNALRGRYAATRRALSPQ